MTIYQRVRATRSIDVEISADAFFDALVVWDASASWENTPLPMKRVELFPGHVNGRTPCTRLCYPDLARLPDGVSSDMMPSFIPETLLQIDRITRFIMYRLDGEGPLGVRNYVATTEVDELGVNRARVTCRGRGDLPSIQAADELRAVMEATYEHGVILGTVKIARRLALDPPKSSP